ncbi:hypothetical protein FA95DRAFT_1556969 [Auriscalpium vulgare]|uniref:Uncharacterized protein n=1 Tax=Auriscalpium vulgare TaxID=40419 RepID=A0ACB8RZ55_9AGAM|nr:hypothetical protein FA95DRAFT_1556969 [Auriscalpium vulgare]
MPSTPAQSNSSTHTIALRVEFSGLTAVNISAKPVLTTPVISTIRNVLATLRLPQPKPENVLRSPAFSAADIFWLPDHAVPFGKLVETVITRLLPKENPKENLLLRGIMRLSMFVIPGRSTTIASMTPVITRTPDQLSMSDQDATKLVSAITNGAMSSEQALLSTSTTAPSTPKIRFPKRARDVDVLSAAPAVSPIASSASVPEKSPAQTPKPVKVPKAAAVTPPQQQTYKTRQQTATTQQNPAAPQATPTHQATRTTQPSIADQAALEQAALDGYSRARRAEVELAERQAELLDLRTRLAAVQEQAAQASQLNETRQHQVAAAHAAQVRRYTEAQEQTNQRLLALSRRLGEGSGARQPGQQNVQDPLFALEMRVDELQAALSASQAAQRDAATELQESRDLIVDMMGAAETTENHETLSMGPAVERLLARLNNPDPPNANLTVGNENPNADAALSPVETYVRGLQARLSEAEADLRILEDERNRFDRMNQISQKQLHGAEAEAAKASRRAQEFREQLETDRRKAALQIIGLRDILKAGDSDSDVKEAGPEEENVQLDVAISSLEAHIVHAQTRLEDERSGRRAAELSFQTQEELMQQMLNASEAKANEEEEAAQIVRSSQDVHVAAERRAIVQRINQIHGKPQNLNAGVDVQHADVTAALTSLEGHVHGLRESTTRQKISADKKAKDSLESASKATADAKRLAQAMKAMTQRIQRLLNPVPEQERRTDFEGVVSALETHMQTLRSELEETHAAGRSAERKVLEQQDITRGVMRQLETEAGQHADTIRELHLRHAGFEEQVRKLEEAQHVARERLLALQGSGGAAAVNLQEIDVTGLLAWVETHISELHAIVRRVERELEDERAQHAQVIRNIERECHEPFVVPALLQTFATISSLTDSVMA